MEAIALSPTNEYIILDMNSRLAPKIDATKL